MRQGKAFRSKALPYVRPAPTFYEGSSNYIRRRVAATAPDKKPMHLTASVINKLGLARHLYLLALDCIRSHRELALFAAVNLLQDSVEAFLLAASEHLNSGIDSTTTFERYFQKIEERINPRTLPFRSKLVALNKVRVAAKHHGVKPDSSEAEGFALICREFFDESCNLVFGVQFLSVSLIDLLDGGEIKELLVAAKSAFDERQWYNSMIECRKVIFLEFENQFNVENLRMVGKM